MTIPWGAPHVAAAVKEIDARFTGLGDGGTYPGHGEDPPGAGFAADFWTTDKAKHDEVFAWLRHNAVRLGIKYVISWRRIWSVARASEGVREYTRYDPPPNTASQDHTNHLHVSFDADPPEEEDMPLSSDDIEKIAAKVLNLDGEIPNKTTAGSVIFSPDAGAYISLKNAVYEQGKDLATIKASLSLIKAHLKIS